MSRLIERDAAPSRRLIFLGTGTSSGVPMIGCECPVCTSSDPRNQRTRPSVLLSFPGGNLLIDTTPEMRIQLLRERVRLVHAIAFTHAHADHLFGLDDARLFPEVDWAGRCRSIASRRPRRRSGGFSVTRFGPARSSGRRGLFPSSSSSRVAPGVEFEVLGERVCRSGSSMGKSPVLGFRVGGAGLLHRCEPDSRRELAAPARGWTSWSWTRCGMSRIRRTFR